MRFCHSLLHMWAPGQFVATMFISNPRLLLFENHKNNIPHVLVY